MQQGSKNRKLQIQVLATLKNEVEVGLHATRATEMTKAATEAATGVKEKEEAEIKRTIAPELRSILL